MESVIFPISLVAAFIAGMVALFAPCCITFLLPAYLGSVFKEKEKVMLMTLVFGVGIFVVLLPAVLGVALVSQLLFRYHNLIYILGGIIMLGVALTTFLGIKLPMPQLRGTEAGNKADILSIFTLGIFSGVTSACCAPVLIGILTLTFLSPSFLGAILVGAMYVLGMVTPLLVISAFLTDKLPKLMVLRKPIFSFNFLGKDYPAILSNVLASIIFLITGSLTLILAMAGRLSAENMEGFTKTIQNAGWRVNDLLGGGNTWVNLAFVVIVIFFIYLISKKV